jgi:Cu2+-containing amine oxidase
VANSGNYDYISSVSFGLDGRIRWTTELAGFCETRWFNTGVNAWERDFSPLWHDDMAIPVHLHTLNIKVDLDIGSHTANAVQKLESVAGQPSTARSAGVLAPFPTKYLNSSYLAREGIEMSTLSGHPSNPQVWAVVNRELQGPSSSSPPGYAILLGEATRNTLPEGHPLVDFVAYSKYGMVVTKRHDNEPHPTSVYDAYAPGQPFVSLNHYLKDGEDLNSTDVVAWVTLAHEHVPRTEDVPLITNYALAFNLLPWNLFDGNAAQDLPADPPSDCLAHAL